MYKQQGGNPADLRTSLDSRLRGNDGALDSRHLLSGRCSIYAGCFGNRRSRVIVKPL